MKKAIFYLLACVLLPVAASADEGMWLVSTFRDVIYPQMKKEGLKLKGIDGGPHKQRSMWFNSTQREEPYQVLTST